MHDTAYESGRHFFECYWRPDFTMILDIGAYDVNGTLRDFCPPGARYVGVDLEAGPSVDVVRKDPHDPLPFDDATFDAIVSSSCFEHDQMFWLSFLEMRRVLKPDGYIYLNAPSTGAYHTFPYDNWRFYPDAGLALAAWARRSGYPDTQLIESLTLRQREGAQTESSWNDFVAVFGGRESVRPDRMLSDIHGDAFNIRRGEGAEVANRNAMPQNIHILRRTRKQLEQVRNQLAAAIARRDAATADAKLAREKMRQAQTQMRQIKQSFAWKVARPLHAIETVIRGRGRRKRPKQPPE